MAEERGGWVAAEFVCMYVGQGGNRLGRVGVGGWGVVCALCVWLLCLPLITPCNLAVKGWP